MPDIAVVQWSRLGDILQTRALLRALQRSRPAARLTLFADARYAEIVRRLPEKVEFCPVNLSELTGAARHTSSQTEFLKRARDLLSSYEEIDWEEVLVLTRSPAAVLFAGMLRPERTRGYAFQDGRLTTPPQIQWLQERFAAGLPAPVHLSDAWRTLVESHTLPEWLPTPHRNAKAERDPREPRQIALLCDAGETYRGISEIWLADLAKRILDESQCRLLLLGRKTPLPACELGEWSRCAGDRVSDFRGQTGLAELCDRLNGCDLVVGPDTGGLHLACALNVPVIGIYFGGARAMNTGPYHARVVVVENPAWSAEACKSVAQLAVSVLAGGDIGKAACDIPILTPRLDDYGVVFAPCDMPSLSPELFAVREAFFRRFARPAGAAANDPKNAASRNDLTVIVPECGANTYTEELLPDLQRELGDEGEVVLVCSGPSAARPSTVFPDNVRCLRVAKPMTYAEACNHGARQTNRKWLLFLNNDTRLPPGALRTLLAKAEANRLLSPLLRYPDGLIQNAGIHLEDGQANEIAHGLREAEESRPPDAVSAVALLMSRAAFERLRGFDENYRNGYEDLDLCLRAAELGLNFRVTPAVSVVHFRGSSPGRFDHDSSNHALFANRWGERLRRTSPAARQRECPENAAPMVMVSDEPAEAAGSRLRWIWPLERCGLQRDRDYHWLCPSKDAASTEEMSRRILAARCLVVFRPLSDSALRNAVMEHAAQKNACLWVDADDLFLGRFSGASPRAQAWRVLEHGFHDLLRQADVITVSTTELQKDLQSRGFKAALLETQPSAYQLAPEIAAAREDGKFIIGFFGTPSHLTDLGNVLPALEAVLEGNSHVWFYWWGCRPGELAYHPRVRQGGPMVRNYEAHLWRLHRFGLDAAIVPLLDSPFARAKTAVKFFEYALAGVPAVYSSRPPYSNRVRHGETGLLTGDSTAEWIHAVETLLTNAPLRERIAAEANLQVRRRVHDPNADATFKQILMKLLSRPARETSWTVSSESMA